MKLRFRGNSLRLRLNQREVRCLSEGSALQEEIRFPGESRFTYILEPASQGPRVSFQHGRLQILAPQTRVAEWAEGTDIGIYFEVDTGQAALKVAIEKDLECIDGPVEERDPDAFPRPAEKVC